jgi:hypothetical protein
MAQAPFVINKALSAIAIDYGNKNRARRGLIADQVLPRERVDAPEFRYVEYPIAEAFHVPDTNVGRTSKPNQINLTASEQTGAVEDYALDANVPFRDEMAARGQLPFPLRARGARIATNKVQMAREIRAANLLFSAGNYATGYKVTNSGTTQWSHASSTPVTQIQAAIDSMLVRPNVLLLGSGVRNPLRSHAEVGSKIGGSGTSGRQVDDAELAELLGIERIINGNALYATSKKGQTLTTGAIWGKHAALLYIPNLGDDGFVDEGESADPVFAKTFQWGDRVSGEIQDPDMGMHGGVRVRSGESVVEKLISQYAGYLFTDAAA